MVAFKGVWTQSFWKAVSAEFLGTLIFVLLGLGSTISWTSADSSQPADLVLISLCFGYGIVTMVHCFGHISGAHINPAVTIALVCTRKLTLAKSVFYIIAQCLGAILGAGLLYLITPNDISGNLGVTMINERLSIGHGLLIELIITFQLVFTISASCDPKNKDRLPALAIGISVVFGHLFAINYTGASMNPARSLGPAVIMWKWDNHWIYCIVPIIGAICAGAAYNYIYCPDADFKQHLKEALKKAKQKTNGKYIEVGDNRSQVDTDDLILKSGTIHVIDIEQGEGKKGKDSASEILSTV
ncbi:PREDICTED: aquaporin-4-like isoform X2 [Nanorana parkeri]|uniref:aquaporin-4-like isoform X2 n=1 Tax=Nanorana parkeri TaxID=125878 RepID=UPI000853F2DB|nr:PREDICTED: aquaporin-4-like isoform X2 [Nanorana parkeri]